MTFRSITRLAAVLLVGSAITSAAIAQEPSNPRTSEAIDRIQLFDSLEPSSGTQSKPSSRMSSAQEIRQSRALYRDGRRVSRIERNLNYGHEPLRPNWGSTPMTTTRYTRPRVYIPVFVYTR